jgi:hypothetical protein
MNENTRAHVLRYFRRPPEWPYVLAAVGLLLALVGPGGAIRVLGAAVTAAGVFAWYTRRNSVKDADIDAQVAHDVQHLEARALDHCDLDPSETIRDPVVIVGPRFRNLGGAQFGFRRGRDGVARFTPLHVTVVNFTEHQLMTYQCALDLATGKPLNEQSEEFFYADVVSVSLRSDAFTYNLSEVDSHILARANRLAQSAVNGMIQVADAELFRLTTAGGTAIEVMLKDPVLIEQLGGGEVATQQADDAVQAIRRVLRDKKKGALPLRRHLP